MVCRDRVPVQNRVNCHRAVEGDVLRDCYSVTVLTSSISQPAIGIVLCVQGLPVNPQPRGVWHRDEHLDRGTTVLTPGSRGPQSVVMRGWADRLYGATVCTPWVKVP